MPKILSNADFFKNEVKSIVIDKLTDDPSNPVAGQMYFNTSDNILFGYNGNEWKNLMAVSDTGTTDYDALSNKPFINLTGEASSPIVLESLAVGSYILRGYYKYISSEVTPKQSDNLLMLKYSVGGTIQYFIVDENNLCLGSIDSTSGFVTNVSTKFNGNNNWFKKVNINGLKIEKDDNNEYSIYI